MTPPETSGSTSARHKYPNADKAKESDLKDIFMRIVEVLKQEIQNSLIEIEEKKIWKKSTNAFKKAKKIKKKTLNR